MDLLRCPLLCLEAAALLAGAGWSQPEAGMAWSIRNGYFDVRGEGSGVTFVAFDPGGQGDFGRNLVRRMSLHGVRARRPAVATTTQVRWPDCEVVRPLQVGTDRADTPVMLQPGHTLGQSFTILEGSFTAVSVKLPTWSTTDSDATLRLRRGGPEGEVLASRRLEDVADNSWQDLTFPSQPAGVYTVELSEPEGQIGWWSLAEGGPAGSEAAHADGQPAPGLRRTLAVTGQRVVGRGDLTLTLRGNRLLLELRAVPVPDATLPAPRLECVTFWQNSGYDVSSEAVPFYRFFTDNQRYMPVEQLKRSDIGGHLTFAGAQWIEAEGTDNYDLRFAGRDLSLNWEMTEDDLVLQVGSSPRTEADGTQVTELEIAVLPRSDTTPTEWPAFETPDPALTSDLNRFFYERAFSYPAPAGPAPWLEWSALIRLWVGGTSLANQGGQLAGIVMDEEGYVYTWGGEPGWPFPDPKRYDTRHFDTNARFILGCWRYACWTRDEDFLRDQAERIRRAMSYQLTTLRGEDGLIVAASPDVTGRHMGVGNNYWDILPFGHLDAYANAVYYASLQAMAEIEELIDGAGGVETESPRRSPRTYLRLAERTKAAYNDAFWDEEKGRYIGCIDIDGERHDYGFTFVNLEAMAYGLASEEQARRIYHWMETEPTSTGEADTYTAYIFAPRSNTIHNPRWSPEDGGKTLEPDNPVEPWWHFGWRGTPYGDVQCQDGGAILYTSYFDLMARTKLVGIEDAWRRWSEILGRYRAPDRLCGGGPLYRGENPQRVNAGAVGVDIPFPESGLVPIWFLYGVAGVNATAEGLEIRPNLPAALPWLGIRNIAYRGLTLDLLVTPTSARLVSRTPGYRFTWERSFPEGEGCLFVEPPAPLKGFPEKPKPEPSAIDAEWIWAPGGAAEQETVYLRHTFELPARPKRATIDIAADNYWTLYVNGVEVRAGEGWAETTRVAIGRQLQKGPNVIAVAARNGDGPGGMLARAMLRVGEDAIEISSSPAWHASREAPELWAEADFDDSGWEAAASFGKPPVGPWGEIKVGR